MHRAPNAVALSLLALAVPLALAGLAPRAPAQAFTLPPHFEVVALPGAYNLPVGLTFAADGTALLLQKPGIVSVLDPAGTLQAAPFLDLSAEVNNDWDRGLLGVALHPGFVPDGGATSWVYLLYTVSPVPPNDTVQPLTMTEQAARYGY